MGPNPDYRWSPLYHGSSQLRIMNLAYQAQNCVVIRERDVTLGQDQPIVTCHADIAVLKCIHNHSLRLAKPAMVSVESTPCL